MKKMAKQWCSLAGWLGITVQLFLLTESAVRRQSAARNNSENVVSVSLPPVQMHLRDSHVVVDNGIVRVTFSRPGGMVTRIQYGQINNLLEDSNTESDRGYWDVVYTMPPEHPDNIYDKLEGTMFKVIMEEDDQIELAFITAWDPSANNTGLPLNIDKRFIFLRGTPGFYSYAIFERLEGWPDINMYEGRIVFKLREDSFQYMAVSDERQRIMPMYVDRETGEVLDYKEAVLLTKPRNPFLEGEVDDKYQYSSDNKDNRVHGWICADPPVGFWMITGSNEFRTGGPVKQDLTSHTGPFTLFYFFSTHYAGEPLGIKFRNGDPWKKVFGPVFIYLNSVSAEEDPLTLWADAKEQMLMETKSWPYDFPLSDDYPYAHQRGSVSGRLLVRDRYFNKEIMTANSAYVGLAAPGDAGYWQRENKGYQFWTQTDVEGYFLIRGVRPGNYSLYAWVPGFIGDYKYDVYVGVETGSKIRLGNLVYDPPRNGPTLWEIGIPDRTAAEFYVPEPNPTLLNKFYVGHPEKFRQYGLWNRYSELYPDKDLTYIIGVSNYRTDWFFAQVNRNIGNKTYIPTTWQISFDLGTIEKTGNYTLQLALASANEAELQVRINELEMEPPHFTTGAIGKDNAIARHGIHGLYWIFSVDVPATTLLTGNNKIFLTQSRGSVPWKGIMYDYIRFEGPPEQN